MIRKLLFTGLAALAFVACEDGVITEDDRPIDVPDTNIVTGRPMANLEYIQDSVFTPTCAVSGCHVTGMQPPLLEKGKTEDLIGTVYIKPQDPMGSRILQRMSAKDFSIMPPQGTFPPHPQPVLDSIAAWIEAGAPTGN